MGGRVPLWLQVNDTVSFQCVVIESSVGSCPATMPFFPVRYFGISPAAATVLPPVAHGCPTTFGTTSSGAMPLTYTLMVCPLDTVVPASGKVRDTVPSPPVLNPKNSVTPSFCAMSWVRASWKSVPIWAKSGMTNWPAGGDVGDVGADGDELDGELGPFATLVLGPLVNAQPTAAPMAANATNPAMTANT